MARKKREYFHVVIREGIGEVGRIRGLTGKQARQIAKLINGEIYPEGLALIEPAPKRKRILDHKDRLDIFTKEKIG